MDIVVWCFMHVFNVFFKVKKTCFLCFFICKSMFLTSMIYVGSVLYGLLCFCCECEMQKSFSRSAVKVCRTIGRSSTPTLTSTRTWSAWWRNVGSKIHGLDPTSTASLYSSAASANTSPSFSCLFHRCRRRSYTMTATAMKTWKTNARCRVTFI